MSASAVTLAHNSLQGWARRQWPSARHIGSVHAWRTASAMHARAFRTSSLAQGRCRWPRWPRALSGSLRWRRQVTASVCALRSLQSPWGPRWLSSPAVGETSRTLSAPCPSSLTPSFMQVPYGDRCQWSLSYGCSNASACTRGCRRNATLSAPHWTRFPRPRDLGLRRALRPLFWQAMRCLSRPQHWAATPSCHRWRRSSARRCTLGAALRSC
mmetsp:Transcript_75421/g.244039  ORF Transcript_75421/g.244039 Transcript_75421/m.244039 type:complete len:213 (-) Transcript_75421:558-1196(-)